MFVGESTFPGRIFKVTLEGKVLGVIGRSGRQLKQFSGAHQLACPSETELYVAETSNWRVQKLVFPSRARLRGAGSRLRAPGSRKNRWLNLRSSARLQPDELQTRREGLLAELRRRVRGIEDRPDGYRLHFAGGRGHAGPDCRASWRPNGSAAGSCASRSTSSPTTVLSIST